MTLMLDIFTVLTLFTSVLMLFVASTTMWWQTHAFASRENLDDSYWEPVRDDGSEREIPVDSSPLSMLLLVPAVQESENVLEATVSSVLERSVHRNARIVITVPAWDTDTLAAAYRVVDRYSGRDIPVEVSKYYGNVKNKPSQLQSVFDMLPAPGEPGAPDVVGIFDAETQASSRVLEMVDYSFRTRPEAVAVQGSIQLMNMNDSWAATRCALEYFWWFRSRMHRSKHMGVVPLGGNTVFFRYEYLYEIGGWNTNNLAEDAEIGIRISALGPGSIVAGYHPEISSQEEAPLTLKTMIKQRTRWNIGFTQTFYLGTWKEFKSPRQRLIAIMTLNMPRIQVFTGLALILSTITVMGVAFTEWSPPFVVAFISLLPMISALMVLALDIVALRHLGQEYGVRIMPWTYARLVLTTPIYQISLSLSAIRSEWKYWRKDFAWAKTAHVGRHLATEEAAA